MKINIFIAMSFCFLLTACGGGSGGSAPSNNATVLSSAATSSAVSSSIMPNSSSVASISVASESSLVSSFNSSVASSAQSSAIASSSSSVSLSIVPSSSSVASNSVASKSSLASSFNSSVAFQSSAIASSSSSVNPLVAIISESQHIDLGNTVVLDGGKSYDKNLNAFNFTWKVVAAPISSNVALNASLTSKVNFTPDVAGEYKISLVISNALFKSHEAYAYVTVMQTNTRESTLVIRTVGTDTNWGQEDYPAWWSASVTKDADGYRLLDLELARDSSSLFNYAALLHLENIVSVAPTWGITAPAEWKAFKASHTIDEISIADSGMDRLARSAVLRDGLIKMMDKVFAQENPTRIVLTYSGHGGGAIFFEQMLEVEDAQLFLAHLKKLAGNRPLILDFSTNCNAGDIDFLFSYYKYADYLIASEQLVGGFDPGDVTTWLKYKHDNNLHKFWSSGNSTLSALQSIVVARQNIWKNAASQIPQSVALYDLHHVDNFMQELKATPSFLPMVTPWQYDQDLATYALTTNNINLANELHSLRFQYASNRELTSWPFNTLGVRVSNFASFSFMLQ